MTDCYLTNLILETNPNLDEETKKQVTDEIAKIRKGIRLKPQSVKRWKEGEYICSSIEISIAEMLNKEVKILEELKRINHFYPLLSFVEATNVIHSMM